MSTVMTAYSKQGKTSFAKHSGGRKSRLTDSDRRVLRRIVARKHKSTASLITSKINTNLQEGVSTKTIRCELRAVNIHGRAAISKPLVIPCNVLNDENGVTTIRMGHNNGRRSSGQMNRCSLYSRLMDVFSFGEH